MLQTDEVDDDYFTPVQSTSLANIFGDTSKQQENRENETLKYTPPRPQNIIKNSDDSKLTQCIFACAVTGHEWLNHIYVNKGKLGLAIVKIHKTDTHNIILYDSNKITLSCTSISVKLEVTVYNNHILYYDNLGKYWCIYATKDEITKIEEVLKSLNITLVQNAHKESSFPKPTENNTKDVGSDTDSSLNRKTKSSILNRMGTMGHAILPPQTNTMDKTSDSSDNNDNHIQTKLVKHRPLKNIVKRNLQEKSILLSDPQKGTETQQRVIVHKRDQLSEQNPLYTNVERVLMSIPNPGLYTKASNEFDYFVSEQRISNSELRINLNRLSDKIDHIAEKVNNLEYKDRSNSQIDPNNFQMEILQKLMLEYEHKIKVYEDYFKSKGINEVLLRAQKNHEVLYHQENENKIKELTENITNKDNEISRCQNEIQVLLQKVSQQSLNDKMNTDLLKKIADLEQIMTKKNEDLLEISKNYEYLQSKTDNSDVEKLKNILNETYSIIANNFDNNDMYKGEVIKKTLAGVIKKVTVNLIQNL